MKELTFPLLNKYFVCPGAISDVDGGLEHRRDHGEPLYDVLSEKLYSPFHILLWIQRQGDRMTHLRYV
jgi:hypothetical protein